MSEPATKRTGQALANIRANAARRTRPLAERYWAKVDKRGPDECWPWLGNLSGLGYGQIYPGPDRAKRPADTILAHHVAMELAGVEVPPGMVRDHMCKRRDCQNPAHIRVVTQYVNTTENSDSEHAKNSRKTHCTVCGGEYAGANLAIAPSRRRNGKRRPTRVCLTCYPKLWRFAVERRGPPPGAKPRFTEWVGPFRREDE